MKTLTTQELHQLIDSKEDFVLINVLPESSFDEEHIPGSHNVPHQRETFTEEVRALAGGKLKKIVVYCASRKCDASPTAAMKLRKAGFTQVFDYEEGVAGWRAAGNEVESSARATR